MKIQKIIESKNTFENSKIARLIMYVLVFLVLYGITIISLKDNLNTNTHLSSAIFYISLGLLMAATEAFIFYSVYSFNKKIILNNLFFLICIIILISSVIFIGSNIISVYVIPFAFVSMICSMIFEPVVTFSISLPLIGLISCLTDFSYDKVLLYIISCFTAVLLSKRVTVRSNLIFNGLVIGIVNCFVIIILNLITKQQYLSILFDCGMALLGGVLSSILVIGILPVFEHFFEIITTLKLLELSNPNEPILKKMLFEAPGTYHHSIIVGNLAEAAAEVIGANSLLARAGAFYHDIGKIKRPYFFRENQMNNDNPHDKITPKLSTIIITSHVRDGLELAAKYKVPKYIQAIIEEHHGTSLVKFFYNKAVNDPSSEEEIDEAFFRYMGPNPSTKESGIVMLADGVEASVRSLVNPTKKDITSMIEKIFKDRIESGQLNSCDLTMKDINDIKNTFIKVMEGIFHNRIEYPQFNDEIKIEELLK